MSVVRRQGIKNTVFTYLGIVLGVLSTLYIQPFFLTQEQIGITRLIISVATIMASVSCLGITGVIIKFFPLFKDSEKKHNGFFTLALTFPFLGFLICLGIFYLLKQPIFSFYGKNADVLEEYFWPITLTSLFTCLVFSFTAYCNAINKSTLPTFINEVLNRIGFIACILLFFYGVTTMDQYIYSLSLIFLIQLVLLLLIIAKYDHPHVNPSFFSNNKHLSEIIRFGLIASFIQITGICLKFIDVLFVGKYLTMQKVGIYSIAAFIGLVLETPLTALEKIAGAKIARLFAENNFGEIEKIYKLSSKYLMVFCGLLGCILVSCIEPALSLLPGDYSSGVPVAIVVCIGAFFNSATGVNYSILTYSNQYKLGAIFYSGLLVVTCALNVWLIPIYGIMGAAIATASASVIHNILRFILINSKLKMQPFTAESLRILIIVLVSLFSVYFISMENKILLMLLRGSLTTLVFIVLLVLLKVFTVKELKEELLSLKKTFF